MAVRAIFLSLVLLTASAVPGAPAPSDAARYRHCLSAVNVNAAAALADAESWIRDHGGVPAQHCSALALVGLKRYGEAGSRLDTIAADRAVPDMAFRAQLFDQAGNAWLLAGDGTRAVKSFSAALTLSGGDADLFADLARAQAMRKNWPEVELDLNAALQLAPARADLLVLRASARRALKRYPAARTDIETALKLKPGEGGALVERGLLKRQLGDLGGARRDFESALKTGAAAEAKANLDQLAP